MEKPIPPEIIQPILDVLEAAAFIFIGWVAKWLQKLKSKNNDNNYKK